MQKQNKKDIFELLLTPLSIVLSSLFVVLSIIYGASVILDRDQLITKNDLRTVIREELANANLSNSNNTSNNLPEPTPIQISQEKLENIIKNQKIVIGNKDAKLKFIEFADPSCPFCSLAAGNNEFLASYPGYVPPLPEIKKLVNEGKASYTWIYFPTHGNGEIAAQVFYCANEKGKFFDVHDKLMVNEGYKKIEYEVQNDVNKVNLLTDYIKDIIDPNFITECVKSGKYKKNLQEDTNLAGSLGISGTPMFFVNNERVSGSDYTNFEVLIQKYSQ